MNIQIETMIYPINRGAVGMTEIEKEGKKTWVPAGNLLKESESLIENVLISLHEFGIENPLELKLKGIISEVAPKWRKELILFSCIVEDQIGKLKYYSINDLKQLKMPQIDQKLDYSFLFNDVILLGDARFDELDKLLSIKFKD